MNEPTTRKCPVCKGVLVYAPSGLPTNKLYYRCTSCFDLFALEETTDERSNLHDHRTQTLDGHKAHRVPVLRQNLWQSLL